MNVGDKLLQVRILLTENGLVAIVKKVPVPAMPSVECYRIPGQKAAHDRCDRNRSCAKKQMHVIVHQRPSETSCPRFLHQTGESSDKILPVLIIVKNPITVDASNHDVV